MSIVSDFVLWGKYMYLKVFKFIPRRNLNIRLAVFFLILGFVGFFDFWGYGNIFIWPMAGTVLIINEFLNVTIASYVSVFPEIKKLTTWGLTLVSMVCYLVMFSIYILLRGFLYSINSIPTEAVEKEVMYVLALMLAFQIYLCIGIKKPIVTFISLGVVAAVVTSDKDITDYLLTKGFDDALESFSIYQFAALGYLGIVLIAIFSYTILRITYNIPYPRRLSDSIMKQENLR